MSTFAFCDTGHLLLSSASFFRIWSRDDESADSAECISRLVELKSASSRETSLSFALREVFARKFYH